MSDFFVRSFYPIFLSDQLSDFFIRFFSDLFECPIFLYKRAARAMLLCC